MELRSLISRRKSKRQQQQQQRNGNNGSETATVQKVWKDCQLTQINQGRGRSNVQFE